MKSIFKIFSLIALTSLMYFTISSSEAQTLPSEMHFSPDGRILHTGGLPPTGFYDYDTIRSVYLNFPQTNYWQLLTANYASETLLQATMTCDGETLDSVGVRFRGNTSYMMVGNSQKKSFAVVTDFIINGQKFMGYKNLKFNNAHQDATFMREVLYGRMARKYTPIAKGSYIRLFLNNQDWGIYTNIQPIDKTFLKEWFLSNDGARFRPTTDGNNTPGWGDGTAGMNYLGANTATYQNYYTLKSNDIFEDPWKKLIDAFEALSQANAQNIETVKTFIDVDKALWFLACENIFTDDDSYIMKGKMDYMIYIDAETGRTVAMEYDGNSTFVANAASSNNWGPFKNATNVNYPLLNKLLNIPEWRQRYLAHYRTILQETFTPENANALINEIDLQIKDLVAADTKKLYSTTQYTSGVPALKSFVTNRRNFLLSNAEVAQIGPVISEAPFHNSQMQPYTTPISNEIVNITATVSAPSGIQKVFLYYANGLVGNFEKVQMFDDGNHNDGLPNDGIYGAQIPGHPANSMVRYYIEAIAANASLSASYLPAGAEHDVFIYMVEQGFSPNGVVVNELVASNSNGAQDEAGEFEDWIELYNNNDFDVDLSGYYLSDKTDNITKWQFPEGSIIAAKGYMIIWADEDQEDGPLHANFKLSASGESVTLSNPEQNIVDQYIFDAIATDMAFARMPNGTGDFVIQEPTFNANNEGDPSTEIAETNKTPAALMTIFPNPATSVITFNVHSGLIGTPVKIMNLLGEIVISTIMENSLQLNIEPLQTGIYIVRCGPSTQKFIKK